jgi:hypothetical protein
MMRWQQLQCLHVDTRNQGCSASTAAVSGASSLKQLPGVSGLTVITAL